MSEKNVAARKAYWASMTEEERSAKMRALATGRQKKMTFKQKRDHALKMVAARKAKPRTKLFKPVIPVI